MKTSIHNLVTACVTVAFLSACAFPVRAADESPTAVAILQKAARSSQLAPALEEIVKLTKAGVADTVTLAYIQSSPTPFPMDAQDILRLTEQGVSSPVMTAMMQHSDELRRAAEANNQAQAVAAAPANQPAAPAPVAVESAPAVTYPSSSVSVTYIGYPSYSYSPSYAYYGGGFGGYCYPGYCGYASRYVGYCGPRVGFGVGCGYSRGYHGGYVRCR